jgi:hypothetical protein
MKILKIGKMKIFIDGTWFEVSDGEKVVHSGNCTEDVTPERVYQDWLRTLNMYDASFKRNGVYQSNLVRTDKNVSEIRSWFKENRPDSEILGILFADSDSLRPGKPVIIIQ